MNINLRLTELSDSNENLRLTLELDCIGEFIYSKPILLPRINCTLCAGFCKHFAIFSLSAFRNQFSLLKLRNFYHATINTVENGPYLKH